MIMLNNPEIRIQYLKLLKDLSTEDKLLRFGYHITEQNLIGHIDRILDTNITVYGVFDPIHGLVAAIEVWKSNNVAELGMVVSDKIRGQGIGSTLFKNTCIWLHATGITEIIIFTKAHNTWMRRIASAVGMKIIHAGGGDVEYQMIYDGIPQYSDIASMATSANIAGINRHIHGFMKLLNYLNPFSPKR
jgi:RimJ/RimL family protein N-acetyltransferase